MRLSGEAPMLTAGAQTSSLHIETREFTERDRLEWDEFVFGDPHGSPLHLIAWKKTLEESFPYKPFYLLARDSKRICGVLPLFLVKNPILGKALISTPFAVYGGILADSDEARQALYQRVNALGVELGVQYIELRNAFPEQCGGEPNVSRYVTFTQELPSNEEKLLEALPKKTRNVVRKALKTPFSARYGIRDVSRLDALHSRNMRRLGTPCFPRRYFERLLANFGDMVDIREVWLDDKLMAASVNFFYQGEMHTYHAASDTRFNALAPNTFMYYDHLRWAAQNGLRIFDFGRSKRDTGTFEFKRHWNTTMRALPYELILVRRKEMPNFSPANPKFDLVIGIWKRLPLPVTRLLGPLAIQLFP